MTSPEKTNISKAAEQMTFAADFKRDLDDQEKQEAAKKLDDLVKSTLEKFRDQVNDWSHLKINKDKKEYLSLMLQVPQEDGSSVGIRVESTLSNDGIRSGEISVDDSRELGVGEYHRYYIEDGQVLRFDNDFSKPKRTPSVFDENTGGFIIRDLTLQEEKDRGINHQPVGVDEIDKLAALLESAVPDKQYTNLSRF